MDRIVDQLNRHDGYPIGYALVRLLRAAILTHLDRAADARQILKQLPPAEENALSQVPGSRQILVQPGPVRLGRPALLRRSPQRHLT